MSLTFKLVGATLGALVLSTVSPDANAFTVTYTTGPAVLCATGSAGQTSQNDLEAGVKSATCANTTAVTEFYKAAVPAGEVGSFAASYQTSFSNTSNDPEDATISFSTGGTAIGCSLTERCFLGVKDGNTNPPWYVFDISGWNGTSAIVLTDFWAGTGQAGKGAISNVSIWGTGDGIVDDDDVVPEPASLALVGLGLVAAGFARRRRRV